MEDEILSQFLSFAGSAVDPDVARQYLEMSGGNLETAVSLFMDHGSGGVGGGGSGGSGGGGSTGGGGATGMASSSVRAPDATRSMRLVGGPPDLSAARPHHGIGIGNDLGMMGGVGDDDGNPNAALVAAIGGPAAREMMRNMMAGDNGGGGMMGMGMDGAAGGMGSTWAAAGGGTGGGTRAANSSFGNDTRRRGSGSRHRSRSGSHGASGGNRGRGRNANRNAGRGTDRRADNDSDDDDDDVQVVDADGQAMDEDDDDYDDEYNYPGDDDDDDDNDLGGSARPDASAARRAPPSLSTMFAQPSHLMHRAGGFMGARNFAKDARRWLLVNVQSDDDFACHALNRDVWRDELVENLVREGFILFQTMSHSNEGQTYIRRYKVSGYPHLAIIDPRTGSLLWRKEGWTQVDPLTAEQFVEIASDFCSRHSFDRMPTAARNAYTNGVPLGAAVSASSSNEGGGTGAAQQRTANTNKRPIHELTEEEQLQAAIRASMEEDAGGNDDDDVEVVEDGDDGKKPAGAKDDAATNDSNAAAAPVEEESKQTAFEKEILSMEVGDEPTSGAIARVQIRMPDGKRLVRKFAGDGLVRVIYAFVAQSNDETRGGRAFELKAKFPPQDLFANIDDGISSCGLNGEAINVIWK